MAMIRSLRLGRPNPQGRYVPSKRAHTQNLRRCQIDTAGGKFPNCGNAQPDASLMKVSLRIATRKLH